MAKNLKDMIDFDKIESTWSKFLHSQADGDLVLEEMEFNQIELALLKQLSEQFKDEIDGL